MITLNKIRELVLSQEQELEKLIFEYFLQKDITNYHNSSFNKNDKKNEIKLRTYFINIKRYLVKMLVIIQLQE